MKVIKPEINGLIVFEPDVFEDDRGYFFESFNEKRYSGAGLKFQFVQDNISKSKYGTIRGLHYQVGEFAQGKLCQVVFGKVLDVAVDIRFGSPTFGKYFAVELSEENHKQLWIPPGFAHGFSVLSEIAIFHYKCTNFYSKEHERAIRFDDPELKINWKINNPIVSEKDLKAIYFNSIENDFSYES